ncbi:hypothetical protein [Phaeocystidibacter marisrubri]|uniref:Uncharacterized protein n=1 Tax=Phaeocystidibacter marisrubri TaxID=1577780 RepID=A0A6L3ZEV8_9FLAO|nr:hypothetical protein [Phaeocystidibacter marisrubri]KAB2815210.1 hypothetical protein F8C82_14030 [Phaeocystidibacter marisrubri]GGH70901.1 hypothetical protein GCM10011318_13380 [Phaeocystidibacter marisrubri]
MNGELSKYESELVASNAELHRAWIEQIEKDLGEQLPLTSPQASWKKVCEVILRVLQSQFDISQGRVPELLYRIDISEAKLRREMMSGKWNSWHELLAHSIAEREALKVIFRFRFSGKL